MDKKALQAKHNKINRKYARKYSLTPKSVAYIRTQSLLENKPRTEIIEGFQHKIIDRQKVISEAKVHVGHMKSAIFFLERCSPEEFEDLTIRQK